jgi:Flp pilus assembly protein TadD
VRLGLAAAFLLAFPAPSRAAERTPAKIVDVRGGQPAAAVSFEGLWSSYARTERAGDAENSRRIFQEIRRLRVERNIASHEVLGLALVAQGLERLDKGDRAKAEEQFRSAIALAPTLPDAYFGLAKSALKAGPLGFLSAARDTLAGVFARFPTARGSYNLRMLLIPAFLLGLFATTWMIALAFVLRYGGLLRHDLGESLGRSRSSAVALAFYVVLLLAPVATFQGYGWLPLWWIAILFVFLTPGEKAVAVALLAASAAVVPLLSTLEGRLLAARNPLFWAGVQSVEGSSDTRSIALLDAAVKREPADRDVAYLLASHYRKAGRYEETSALYNNILQADPADLIAKNNLANVEFARGEFQSAIARYKQGAEAGGPPEVQATFYYNQSLAHLQRFEYQPAQEAKSNADRLAGRLVAEYDRRWRYDKGDYAVVDLGFTLEQVWEKFDRAADGVGIKNVARGGRASAAAGMGDALLNRFTGFLAVFGLVVFGVSVWRRKMLTLQCLKCGAIFDARDHRGGAAVGLCPQCYHLYIVRDGVSAPARNRKLLEVQGWDARRNRTFLALTVASPGAGHVYAGQTLLGIALALPWYLVIATLLLGRLLPVTGAPSALVQPLGLALAALLLVAIWVLANRLRPDLDVTVQVKRSPGRRTRTA